MNNLLTVIVLGVYTLIYLVVFLIQKSQLDSVNKINASMRSYMDIFKPEVVKEYVELQSENSKLLAHKFVRDDENVKKIVDEAIKGCIENLQDMYAKEKGEQYLELCALAGDVIKSVPKAERIKYISEALPKTGQELLKVVEAEEQDELNNKQVVSD